MKHQIIVQYTQKSVRMKVQLVEKFISINGEGTRAGEPALFLRFPGCNLNCSYCDTRWANEKGVVVEELTLENLVTYVRETKIKNVTITGGEPLLQQDISMLCKTLIEECEVRIEIETNGSISIREIDELRKNNNLAIALTLDYKLPGSGMEESMMWSNFNYLTSADSVKFVAGSREDLDRGVKVIEQGELKEKCSVFFSPVYGKIKLEDMANYIVNRKLNGIKMQLQLHKFIWDPMERGV